MSDWNIHEKREQKCYMSSASEKMKTANLDQMENDHSSVGMKNGKKNT